jgi:tetratricopeptide (TPR) repeat protein
MIALRLPLLLLAAVVWFGGLRAGAADGRRGNAALEAGGSAAAAAHFEGGLLRENVPLPFQARLAHNLGLARHGQGDAARADSAFADALRRAAAPADRSRYAYNAGTAALLGGDAQTALAHLRRALVLDPAHADARRNLEIALRRLADQQPPQPPEPSAFARQLKAQADRLVAERRYPDALALMEEGLARDSTVAAFSDFIGRLSGVAQIETDVPDDPAPAAPTDDAPTE